jgi:transposase
MTATHTQNSTVPTAPVLYLALELSWSTWKLAFTIGRGQKPRLSTIAARNHAALLEEIEAAKKRFSLSAETPVVSCYEAGRDGFWIDRFLRSHGIQNIVVDSASIEVSRRKRRTKSDRLDVEKLLEMLMRWHNGAKKVWAVVHLPTLEVEDGRQLHRELIALKCERTAHINGIKGLLAGLGLQVSVEEDFPWRLEELRQWDGTGVPAGMRQRLLCEFAGWQMVGRQIQELERQRAEQIRKGQTPEVKLVRRLLSLRGIGTNGAWLALWEFFCWRKFRNRRLRGVKLTASRCQAYGFAVSSLVLLRLRRVKLGSWFLSGSRAYGYAVSSCLRLRGVKLGSLRLRGVKLGSYGFAVSSWFLRLRDVKLGSWFLSGSRFLRLRGVKLGSWFLSGSREDAANPGSDASGLHKQKTKPVTAKPLCHREALKPVTAKPLCHREALVTAKPLCVACSSLPLIIAASTVPTGFDCTPIGQPDPGTESLEPPRRDAGLRRVRGPKRPQDASPGRSGCNGPSGRGAIGRGFRRPELSAHAPGGSVARPLPGRWGVAWADASRL